MKKYSRITLTALLILALLVGITACGDTPTSDPGSTPNSAAIPSTSGTKPADSTEDGCTLILKTQDDKVLPDVTLSIALDGVPVVTTRTDSEGKAKVELDPGTYSISYMGLPAYHLAYTEVLEIVNADCTIVLEVFDNAPNGTAERPYRLSQGVNNFTIPAGTTFHYAINAVAKIIITVKAEDVEVVYITKGDNNEEIEQVCTPNENGEATFALYTGDPSNPGKFTVLNKADQALSVTITSALPMGAPDNPFVLTALNQTETATVEKNETVCYVWTATMDGFLCVGSEFPFSNISMQNLSNSVVTSNTDGAGSTILAVKAGQEIRIMVSTTNGEPAEVPFILSEYAGTEADPIVVANGPISFSCKSGETVYFQVAEANKTLTLMQYNVEITVNGETHAVTDSQSATLQLGDETVFAVTNPGDSTKDLTIKIS